MGGSSVTIGYKYFLGLQFALCEDELTELNQILTNNGLKPFFSYSTFVHDDRWQISKPNLFGGRKKGGGVSGWVQVKFGTADQAASTYMNNVVGNGALPDALGTVPLRGLSTLIAERPYVSAMNPTLRPWEFRVYRRGSHLSTNLVTEKEVTVDGVDTAKYGVDVNPVAIIDECLFNTKWGLGLSTDDVNLASLESAITTLSTEGVGLSLRLADQVSMRKFIREILTHINGVLYVSPVDGKINLRLLRDTDTSELTVDRDTNKNLISVDSFERTAWSSTINELVVQFTNPINYDEDSLALHSTSNRDIQGDIVSRSVTYKGVRSQALAARLAARDIALLSYPLAKLEVTVNKEGWQLAVGSVITLTVEEYQITSARFRVLNIDYGSIEKSAIKLTLMQDVLQDYSSSQTVFGFNTTGEATQFDPVSNPDALASTRYDAIAIPYYTLYNFLTTSQFASYDLALDNFFVFSEKVSSDHIGSVLDDNTGNASGVISLPLLAFEISDGFLMGDERGGTSFTVRAASTLSASFTLQLISDLTIDQINANPGDAALFIDDEIFLIKSITVQNPFSGAYNFVVERGATDTVPAYHISDTATGYFIESMSAFDLYGGVNGVAISNGNSPVYRLRTSTLNDLLPYANSPNITLVGSSRADRPAPPKDVTVAYNATQMTISWSYDDKVTAINAPSTETSYTNTPESTDIRTQVFVRAYDGTTLLNATFDSTQTSAVLTKVTEQGITLDGLVSPSVFIELYCFYFSTSDQSLQRVKIQNFRDDAYFGTFEDHVDQTGNAVQHTNTDTTLAKQYRFDMADGSYVLITSTGNDATIYRKNEDGAIQATISGGNCVGMLAGNDPDWIDVYGATQATATIVWTTNGTSFNVAALNTVDITIDNTFTISDVDFTSARQVLIDSTYIYITDPTQAYPATTLTGAINRCDYTGATQVTMQPNLSGSYVAITGAGTTRWAEKIWKAGSNGVLVVASLGVRLSTATDHEYHPTELSFLERVDAATPTYTELDFNYTLGAGQPDFMIIRDVGSGPSGFAVHVQYEVGQFGVIANPDGEHLLYWTHAGAIAQWVYQLTAEISVLNPPLLAAPATPTSGINNRASRLAVNGTHVYFCDERKFPTHITSQNHRPYYQAAGLYPDSETCLAQIKGGDGNPDGLHYKGSLNRILISTGALNSSNWSHDNPYFVIGANDSEPAGAGFAFDVIERVLALNAAGTRILCSTKYTGRLYWVTTQ